MVRFWNARPLYALLVLLLILGLVPGCIPGVVRDHTPEMNVKVSLSEPPVLGRPVEVRVTFSLWEKVPFDAPNTTARIDLPEGFAPVSGSLTWQGDVLRGKTYEMKATIKAVKTGEWQISATALFSPDPSGSMGGSGTVYVAVFPDRAMVSDRPLQLRPEPPERPWPPRPPQPATPPPPRSASRLSAVTQEFQHPLTIKGKFYCYISENAVPAPNQPPREDVRVPLVWGGVYVYDMHDEYLGGCTTCRGTGLPFGENDGEFKIIVENPYYKYGTPEERGFYIIVEPWTTVAEVFNDNPFAPFYRARYDFAPVSGDSYTMPDDPDVYNPSNESADHRSAWRIYESMADDIYDRGAYFFLRWSARGPGYEMPVVTAYYPSANPLAPCYDAESARRCILMTTGRRRLWTQCSTSTATG